MVRLRSTDGEDVFGRTQHGLLDAFAAVLRHRQHRNGRQYHRDHPMPALSWHDAGENAVARLAESRNGGTGYSRRQPAFRGPGHAPGGSLSWRPLLRYAGWRIGRHLDAFLLDLRAPGSVCARVAGV